MNSPALDRLRTIAINLCGGYYEPKSEIEGQIGGQLLELHKQLEAEMEALDNDVISLNDQLNSWASGCGGCGCG